MNSGKAISIALINAGKTKADLARGINRKPETIYAMCKAKSASTNTLKRIADYLGVTVTELVALGEDK
ncbi:MAG: helix-turn-helix domain-containing protein [Shewanella sp.]|uniref:helix-turn-helix domain-containing protein n=1 Tax=Aeromonas popoffii TaxID=70856 RepID=UPI003F30C2F5